MSRKNLLHTASDTGIIVLTVFKAVVFSMYVSVFERFGVMTTIEYTEQIKWGLWLFLHNSLYYMVLLQTTSF